MPNSLTASPDEDQDGDDYASLTRLIESISEDHGQLRTFVYEFARRKLRRNLYRQFEEGDFVGIQERMRTLEEAIARVESDCEQRPLALNFAPEPPLVQGGVAELSSPTSVGPLRQSLQLLRPLVSSSISLRAGRSSTGLAAVSDYVAIPAKKLRRQTIWWRFELGIAVLIGIFIFAFIDSQGGLNVPGLRRLTLLHNASADLKTPVQPPASEERAKPQRQTKPLMPLPTEYGAYALVNGKLVELSALPMRVPDARVAISPAITTPSHAHLPAGKLSFIIYRRDLANSVPERVDIRVVAQVLHALTFNANGQPTRTNIDDTWVVRSKSYEMKVGPVADNPEMILIRPEQADLVFPAGRYALVLKNVAYDFTVDGLLTDAAHCLERTDALMTPVYSECRNL